MRTVGQALSLVHFIGEWDGQISDHFEIDPKKITEIAPVAGDKDPLKTFRYVVAISGKNRANAAHEFHDRILKYPTHHGVFALYRTQHGTASLLLDINKVPPTANQPATRKNTLTPKEAATIEDFVSAVHGHRMIIIRGKFANSKEFAQAVTNATTFHPHEYLNLPEHLKLPAAVTAHDLIIGVGKTFKGIGTVSEKLPNIPGTKLVKTTGRISSNFGDSLIRIANRLPSTPQPLGHRRI